MPESSRYFFTNEQGNQIEVTEEEMVVVVSQLLEETDIPEDILIKDLEFVANMANHVKDGTIESTGLIQGRVIRGWIGSPPEHIED